MRDAIVTAVVLAVGLLTTMPVGEAAAQEARSMLSAVVDGHTVKLEHQPNASRVGDSVAFRGGLQPHRLGQIVPALAISCASGIEQATLPATGRGCSIRYSLTRFSADPTFKEWVGEADAVHVNLEAFDGTRLKGTFSGTLAPFPARGRLDLLWLGDSTVRSGVSQTSYADALIADLHAGGVHAELAATAGLDAFGYDALLGVLLARNPRVVVMIANLRLFAPSGYWSYVDVLGMAPLAELPRQVALPYERRGLSAAALVAARALRWPVVADAMLWATGMRHIAAEAELWNALGPRAPQHRDWNALARFGANTLRSYTTPRGPDDPTVRMLAAAVERATRHGAQVLVIVTPVPVDLLRERGFYDPLRYTEAIGILRRAVEAEGGTLLDLHAALPRGQFVDTNGHFTSAGHETMRRLAAPAIVQTLARSGVAIVEPLPDHGSAPRE